MAWYETPAARALGVRYPLLQAPMSGFTTPELAAAVSNAGALGSLGAAWLTPADLRAEIRAVRQLTDRPFMVNLFAWPQPDAAPDAHPALDEQLAVVAEERVPVFSFTFGIPDFAEREVGRRDDRRHGDDRRRGAGARSRRRRRRGHTGLGGGRASRHLRDLAGRGGGREPRARAAGGRRRLGAGARGRGDHGRPRDRSGARAGGRRSLARHSVPDRLREQLRLACLSEAAGGDARRGHARLAGLLRTRGAARAHRRGRGARRVRASRRRRIRCNWT